MNITYTHKIETRQYKTDEWTASFGVYLGNGRTKDEAVKDLLLQVNINCPPRNFDICDECDVLYSPRCNRCLGS